jgi:hypothetical protein
MWPFDQSPDTAAVTTRQVLESGLPILVAVHHDDDHSWSFACGTTTDAEDGRVVSMGEALELDPSLCEIADLPPGWWAEREQLGSAWVRWPQCEPEPDDERPSA